MPVGVFLACGVLARELNDDNAKGEGELLWLVAPFRAGRGEELRFSRGGEAGRVEGDARSTQPISGSGNSTFSSSSVGVRILTRTPL